MLRAIIIITSLSLPIVVSSAAADAALEPLHRGTKEHSGWHSIGPAPPTILATGAADPNSHTIYIGSLGGLVIKSTDWGHYVPFGQQRPGRTDHFRPCRVPHKSKPSGTTFDGQVSTDISVVTFSTVGCRTN
jgi:hypothetical protein